MHKLVWAVIGAFFALAMFAATTFAQQKIVRTISGEPGKLFMVTEINAAILTTGDTTRVDFVAPTEQRMAAYKSVDLKEGDIVVMANGKKVAQASDIEKLYTSLKIGEELKLGIKRGTEMRLVVIVKADPKDLPQQHMVTVGDDGNWSGKDDGHGQVKRTLKIPPGVSNPTPLMAAGLLVGDKAGKIVIIDVMPEGAALYEKDTVKVDDVITAFQGQPVKSSADIEALLDKVAIGDKVSMTVTREGKESVVTFAKSEAHGKVMIQKGKGLQ